MCIWKFTLPLCYTFHLIFHRGCMDFKWSRPNLMYNQSTTLQFNYWVTKNLLLLLIKAWASAISSFVLSTILPNLVVKVVLSLETEARRGNGVRQFWWWWRQVSWVFQQLKWLLFRISKFFVEDHSWMLGVKSEKSITNNYEGKCKAALFCWKSKLWYMIHPKWHKCISCWKLFFFSLFIYYYIFFFKQCVLVDITQICQTLLLNPLLFSLVIVYFKVQTNVLHVM